ncbi:MAG TPA: hypothetical protein VKD71_07635 [Gemmataceae bacterium]|nr:hypothetical protein [Gemmataceae bacterium]
MDECDDDADDALPASWRPMTRRELIAGMVVAVAVGLLMLAVHEFARWY